MLSFSASQSGQQRHAGGDHGRSLHDRPGSAAEARRLRTAFAPQDTRLMHSVSDSSVLIPCPAYTRMQQWENVYDYEHLPATAKMIGNKAWKVPSWSQRPKQLADRMTKLLTGSCCRPRVVPCSSRSIWHLQRPHSAFLFLLMLPTEIAPLALMSAAG